MEPVNERDLVLGTEMLIAQDDDRIAEQRIPDPDEIALGKYARHLSAADLRADGRICRGDDNRALGSRRWTFAPHLGRPPSCWPAPPPPPAATLNPAIVSLQSIAIP